MTPWTFGRRLFGLADGNELSQLLRDSNADFPASGVACYKVSEDPAEPCAVAAMVPPLCLQDVVDHELSSFLLTPLTAEQVTAQLESDHRWDVLMPSDGVHFVVGESSQAEAIFEGEHGETSSPATGNRNSITWPEAADANFCESTMRRSSARGKAAKYRVMR